MLKYKFKILVLYLAKLTGMFQLSLLITRSKLRILCFHGGSKHDEHLFWPGVFMTTHKFSEICALIKKYSFKVINFNALAEVNITPLEKPLIITFDDGFKSTENFEPILQEYNFPATLYVTTYYVKHQVPVFRVALQYIYHKAPNQEIEFALSDQLHINIDTNPTAANQSLDIIIKYAATLKPSEQQNLLHKICQALHVDEKPIWQQQIFHNMDYAELKKLHDNSIIDIQLHTHRHDLPLDTADIKYEIEKNRKILSLATGKSPVDLCHFCYPSGVWAVEHLPALKKLNIKTATTLDNKLVDVHQDNMLSLGRILCSETKPNIFLEAELSGFSYILKATLQFKTAKSLIPKFSKMIKSRT